MVANLGAISTPNVDYRIVVTFRLFETNSYKGIGFRIVLFLQELLRMVKMTSVFFQMVRFAMSVLCFLMFLALMYQVGKQVTES